VGEWFSIEVIDGRTSARAWSEAHGDSLIWTAQEHGATDWSWHEHSWGVVLELELADEEAWELLQASTAFRAALDAVPDPIFGLILHRGRGGSAGTRNPRRPRPFAGAGSMALPLPEPLDDWAAPPERVLLRR
jgi:hypothetical protein